MTFVTSGEEADGEGGFCLYAIAFALCAALHVTAIMRIPLTSDLTTSPWSAAFFGVALVVAIAPAQFLAWRLSIDSSVKEFGKAVFRGSPKWMRYGLWGFQAYSVIILAVAMFQMLQLMNAEFDPFDTEGNLARDQASYAGAIQALTAVMIPSLWYGIAVSLSAGAVLSSRRACANGHRLSPFARFCSECGSPASERGDA